MRITSADSMPGMQRSSSALGKAAMLIPWLEWGVIKPSLTWMGSW